MACINHSQMVCLFLGLPCQSQQLRTRSGPAAMESIRSAQCNWACRPHRTAHKSRMCRGSYTRMMTMRYSQPRAMASLHQYISMLRTSHARSDSKHSMRLRDRRLQRMHKPADNSSVPPLEQSNVVGNM